MQLLPHVATEEVLSDPLSSQVWAAAKEFPFPPPCCCLHTMLSHRLLQKASGTSAIALLEMVRQALKLSVKYLKSRATVYFDQ